MLSAWPENSLPAAPSSPQPQPRRTSRLSPGRERASPNFPCPAGFQVLRGFAVGYPPTGRPFDPHHRSRAGGIGSRMAAGLARSRGPYHVRCGPVGPPPPHSTGQAAEMVCSNSFKSDDPNSATGILKAEMRRMESLDPDLRRGDPGPCRQQFGRRSGSLLPDRDQGPQDHPRIQWEEHSDQRAGSEPAHHPRHGATHNGSPGGLARLDHGQWPAALLRCHRAHRRALQHRHLGIAWMAARYDKGGADFYNCPLDGTATISSWTRCSPPIGSR